jgi:hypothetical protein
MQKVKRGSFTHLPKLRLFREDIEKLITLFEQNFDNTKVIINDYIITGPTDIDQIKEPIAKNLSIEGSSSYRTNYTEGYVSLELRDHIADIYLSDSNDPRLRGIEYHINSLLLPRKRKTSFLSSYWLICILLFLLETILILTNQFTPYFHGELFYISFFAMPLIIPIWLLLDLKLNSKQAIIELVYSNTKTSFFIRKKDDILLALVSALIGSTITLIITLIAQRLTNPPK